MPGELSHLKLPWGVLAFRFEIDGVVAVIDTGPYDPRGRILDWLRGFPTPPKHLLLTHVHLDHAGMVTALVEEFGCTVWCPPGEHEWLRTGHVRIPEAQEWWSHPLIWSSRFAQLPPIPPCSATLDHWPESLGIERIPTPGHSPDHTSFRLPNGTLLPGDAIAGGRSKDSPRLSCFGEDAGQMVASAKHLAAAEFNECLPSHGARLSRVSVVQWAELLSLKVN